MRRPARVLQGGRWRDPALALLLAGVASLELVTGFSDALDAGKPPVTGTTWAFALAMTLPLALRGRAPVVVGLGVQAVAVAEAALVVPVDLLATAIAAFLVAPYTAAVGARTWRGAAVAGVASVVLLGSQGALDRAYAEASTAPNAVFAVMVWGVAALVRRYREAAAAAARLAGVQAELAVEQERRRVARELHDVVAHGLSVVVLRSRGALHDLDADPASARAALEDVDRVASRALADMRRLLDATAADAAPSPTHRGRSVPARAPQPALADLDELLDDVRGAGLEVALRTRGTARPLTPGAELAVYRVVQEALTNVARHARTHRAQVELDWREDEVELSVHDDGAGEQPGATALEGQAAGGRGLVGMRERVELLGGSVQAGPAPGGGYRVRAVLPVAP